VAGNWKFAFGFGLITTGIIYSAFELLQPSGEGFEAKRRMVSLPVAV